MKIKDCTGIGISGVKFSGKVDDSPGNYKLHLIKNRSFYEDLNQPGRWWNGPNKLQEFDPKTLLPINKATDTSVSETTEQCNVKTITRDQRKKQLEVKNFTDLRQEFQIPFERGLKKAVLIERILDQEGLV